MARIADQRIIVWCNSENHLSQTLIEAIHMAQVFEKELCLFAHFRRTRQKHVLEQKLSGMLEVLKKKFPETEMSVLLLKGKLHTLMEKLGDPYNTILFCAGNRLTPSLLKAFYRSGFPFYFSKNAPDKPRNRFANILIPIDFRNSTKEATLWGSYFGRFNNSEIYLLPASDRDPELKQKVDGLTGFIKKFYSSFLFHYRFIQTNTSSWNIHNEAARMASDYSLLIFTGSLNVSLIDLLTGPFEKRIVNKISDCPVLLVNPQKEMYVLCS
ncbi:MAG TPA: hypothetical protein PLK12_03135 [Prolixibacteraceae bacterium]|nr:hypothetical protein [Prolixibacteraceae bacterium]